MAMGATGPRLTIPEFAPTEAFTLVGQVIRAGAASRFLNSRRLKRHRQRQPYRSRQPPHDS